MISNRSMAPGVIIPEVPYPDVREAAAWLTRVFQFSERLRIGSHRVQLTYRGASIVAVTAPANLGPARQSMLVQVTSVDAHHACVVSQGATVARPPETHPFGERQYTALDLFGHAWTFTESVTDVDPASWGGELVPPSGG